MTSPTSHRLLVVDDEPDLRTLYELTLLREGYEIETAATVEDAWQQLQEHSYSVLITDMRLPDGTGLELLQRLESAGRTEKAIVITAYGSAENAVSALKAGAYDYLTKPVDLKQFRAVVASALRDAESQALMLHEAGAPQPAPPTSSGTQATPSRSAGATASHPIASRQAAPPAHLPPPALVKLAGHSPAMQQVRVLIDKVARSMAPVLVWGESGTGKELVARAIHDVSSRHSGPFIAVNCGAIPEQLLEAEFFGYRKGAFTGASEDREGFFQAAHGGTLFLDEIGDLPLAMQSKLLRAIQERRVRAVGATQEVPVDVRIVSATHKDLQAEVAAQHFRQDLYYRLNVIQITLPPLRERLEDLPILCQRILERIANESGLQPAPCLSTDALAALMRQRFAGNVRELENMLHRAVALSGHARLEPQDLGVAPAPPPTLPALRAQAAADTMGATDAPLVAATAAPDTPASAQTERPQPAAPLPRDLVSHLDEVERDILVQALEKHRLNRTAAGASLGLSLRQMRYRMARLGVQVTEQGVLLGERFDPDADVD
ncbi:MAG: sigma-54-dependent Fis family transcriptional regulator [Proteobacteria bacterium]|uniref:sigma-54-dependent transcriptional regulator n=1 Tax=Aquabacterium sp. TaxID=1872578 RepID=UPI0035C6FAA7|nr:sigma-54-dependent Fis family transcriptional regulator [Pseudomonadota bacterium]